MAFEYFSLPEFCIGYAIATVTISNMQRAVYKQQKGEIAQKGYAAFDKRLIFALRFADVIKYGMLIHLIFQHGFIKAGLAFIIGLIATMGFTIISKDKDKFLLSNWNIVLAIFGLGFMAHHLGYIEYIQSSL